MIIKLVANWARPVVGSGGLQGLLRVLQRRANRAGVVRLDGRWATDQALIERVQRYRAAYGDGGFQRRLGAAR